MLRQLYWFLSFAPAVLFLLGFIYSLLNTSSICGSSQYEMSVMWFIMFIAHTSPWILLLQQRYLARKA